MRSIVGIALVCTAAPAFAGLPAAYDFYPGSPLQLGANFDPNFVTVAKPPCLKFTVDTASQGAVNTQFKERLVTTASSLRSALGVDASLDIRYLTSRGNASFSYNEAKYFRRDSVSFVITAYTEYGTRNVIAVELLEDAKKALQIGPQTFESLCGSRFVKLERRGASVSAVVTLESVDQQFKQDVATEAAGSGEFGAASASFKVKFQQQMERASQEGRLSVDVLSTGGAGFGALSDLIKQSAVKPGGYSAIIGALGNYIEKFTQENAAPLAYIPADIPGIELAKIDLWPVQREKMLSDLVSEYRLFSTYDSELRGIVNEGDPRSTLISTVKRKQLQGAAANFADYLIKLAAAHRSCLESTSTDLTPCSLPGGRPDPNMIPAPLYAPSASVRLVSISSDNYTGIYWPATQSRGVVSQPDAAATSLLDRARRVEGDQGLPVGLALVIQDPYFVDATASYRVAGLRKGDGSAISLKQEVASEVSITREQLAGDKFISLKGADGLLPSVLLYHEPKPGRLPRLELELPSLIIERQAVARGLAIVAFRQYGAVSGDLDEIVRVRNGGGLSNEFVVGRVSWRLEPTAEAKMKKISIAYLSPGISLKSEASMAVCNADEISTVAQKCVPKTCPDGRPSSMILGCEADR